MHCVPAGTYYSLILQGDEPARVFSEQQYQHCVLVHFLRNAPRIVVMMMKTIIIAAKGISAGI
jgi:hypothetical protein